MLSASFEYEEAATFAFEKLQQTTRVKEASAINPFDCQMEI
jgi:hypothetical protein